MTSPGLTPNDVHDVAFGKPPLGSRGYDEDEVDAFLDRAEQDLAAGRPLGELVASARFSKPPLGKRGYSEAEVDAFLDRLAGSGAGAGTAAPLGPSEATGAPFVDSTGAGYADTASELSSSTLSESPFVESRGFVARLLGRR